MPQRLALWVEPAHPGRLDAGSGPGASEIRARSCDAVADCRAARASTPVTSRSRSGCAFGPSSAFRPAARICCRSSRHGRCHRNGSLAGAGHRVVGKIVSHAAHCHFACFVPSARHVILPLAKAKATPRGFLEGGRGGRAGQADRPRRPESLSAGPSASPWPGGRSCLGRSSRSSKPLPRPARISPTVRARPVIACAACRTGPRSSSASDAASAAEIAARTRQPISMALPVI